MNSSAADFLMEVIECNSHCSTIHAQDIVICSDFKLNENIRAGYFVYYQVNSALTLNHTRRQWIDLGIHPEVCMTQLDTCGAAGGAISLWLRVLDCSDWAGVLSSRDSGTGFQIYCRPPVMRYEILKTGLDVGNLW